MSVNTATPNQSKPQLFRGMRPFSAAGSVRDSVAGVELAAMSIPQALGYASIAGMPAVSGFYTLFLPLLGLPRGGRGFRDSRHSGRWDRPLGAGWQREIYGTGCDGRNAYRGTAAYRPRAQTGLPRRFPFAHRAGRLPDGSGLPGRDRRPGRNAWAEG